MCKSSSYISYSLLIDSRVKVTDNGWTDDSTAAEWFEEVFIPYVTAQNDTGRHILLNFDGHHSHNIPKILELTFQNEVFLYCLPPKTTHKLQPLDIGIFKPLQSAWAQHSQQQASKHHTIMWDTVVYEYMAVHFLF